VETFVIRVWTPAEPDHGQRGDLHGLVEHVRLGEQRPFDGGGELLAFLAAAVAPMTERSSDA
jgi:hypothetical protein